MAIRSVGAGAGISWLRRACNLGAQNPGAVFGGAALLLATMFAGALGLSLLMVLGAALLSADPTASMVASGVVGLGIVALMAVLMVGFLRLIHAVEEGRPASAVDVFSGFRDMGIGGRAIGFVVALTLVQNLVLIALVGMLAPDFGQWYLENLQASVSGQPASPPATLPSGFGAAFGVMLVVGLLFYAVQAVGLGQIAHAGSGIGQAFADGAAGALKNILPLLVFVLVMVGAFLVLALAGFLVAAILGLLARLVGAWLLAFVAIPLYFAFLLAMLVVMFGVMYYVWRDISGDAPPAPLAEGSLEL